MRDEKGRFIKGHPFGKRFNKGHVPWIKGKVGILKHTEEWKEERSVSLRGNKSHLWKGGRKFAYGYYFILNREHPFCDSMGYIREHRIIIETQIGRFLIPSERVHHLDEIKNNNILNNLMAFTSESAHQRFHKNPNNVRPEEIIFDGRKLI